MFVFQIAPSLHALAPGITHAFCKADEKADSGFLQTVVKTHALLKQHGVCVAEELDRDQVDAKTATWFSDRLDLLRLGGLIFDKTPEEHEAQGDSEELCAHMFDVSKPGYERLREFYKDHLVGEELHTLPIIMDELYKLFGEKNVKVASVIPFLHEFLIFLG